MTRLTEKHLAKIKEVLDRYRDNLYRTQHLNARAFEHELRDILQIGYQELKAIILDLSKMEEYEHLAARYMESGVPGVVSEFRGRLAKLYGIPYFHAPEKGPMKKAYWERAFSSLPHND